MLQELANDLRETSCELAKCMSGGDYGRAVQCRRRLDKVSQEAVRFLERNDCPIPTLQVYAAALRKANETLLQVRIKAQVERDRIGRAMRHCGNVKSWLESNRNTF